jgi:predicted nuclease of predicted toxin-antitoxin system
MWLLDKNVPVQLRSLLSEFGIEPATADSKGWGHLTNGKLVAAAYGDGISCILTHDRQFSQSASRALREHRGICIVLLSLPQLRAAAFLDSFREAWLVDSIQEAPGHTVTWPHSALCGFFDCNRLLWQSTSSQ